MAPSGWSFLWTHLNWTEQRKDMASKRPMIPPISSPVACLSIPGTTGSQELFLFFALARAVPLTSHLLPPHCSWSAPVYSFSLSLAVTFPSKSPLSLSSWVGCHTFTPQFSQALCPRYYSIVTYLSNGFPWETRASWEQRLSYFFTVFLALAPT